MTTHEPFGPVGIITAMPDEAAVLLLRFDGDPRVSTHGQRDFHEGTIAGRPVVLVVSRCGKVSAGATATELIVRFGVREIVCTGVAGGLGPSVAIGDVVVASELMQHDFDARPIWPRHVIPFLELARFPCEPALADRLTKSAEHALQNDPLVRELLAGHTPAVHRGLIVSGDQFIDAADEAAAILGALPNAFAVEMEGAAIAQVATEYAVPVGVVRAISDRADDAAEADYIKSLGRFAAAYASGIITAYLSA